MRLWWRMDGCIPGHTIGLEVAEIVGYQPSEELDVLITLIGHEDTIFHVGMGELTTAEPGEKVYYHKEAALATT